jgi:Mrp family chromosome partitioning ATPase
MHGGKLFILAALVLIAGLLLPLPPAAIDILLVVNVVFTAMLFFVVLLAKDPAEITSVPLVVNFIILLHLGTNVGAAKAILLNTNGGRIIDWIGGRIYYGFTSVLITVIFVFLICVLICRAINFLRRKAIGYLVETIPNRQKTLDAEVKSQTITHDQKLRVQNHIDKQRRFFAGMASTSNLLICDCIIVLLVTIVTSLGATALGILNSSPVISASQQYLPLALAVSITTAIPASLVVLALRLLINKKFLLTLEVQSPMPQAIYVSSHIVNDVPNKENITVAAVSAPEKVSEVKHEPIKSKFETETEFVNEAQVTKQEENVMPGTDSIEQETELKSELPSPQYTEPAELAAESVREFSTDTLSGSGQNTSAEIIRDANYYDSILATVGDKEKAAILLVAPGVAQLPLTIAVELAMNIIEMQKKCLLIDMDPARQAIATAFDIDSDAAQAKAVPTEIENLWISPADNPDRPLTAKLSRKVANGLKVFDYVVVYVPNAAEEDVQKQFMDFSGAAIIFGTEKETSPLKEFSKTLDLMGWRTVSEHDLCVPAI